ncbi:MAG TPA: hypothetical protein VEW67_07045 [Thermoleophilaceae bacterium]|nr:hypothetical protein [Thermoleophilaceae bacterium]
MESSSPQPPADEPTSSGRGHRGIALALIFVASLLTFLALPAIWLDRQALNTDNWTETSSELLENEAVRAQIADYLVDQIYANVDVQAELAKVLPPRAEPLAGFAAGGLQQVADDGVRNLLGRPVPQQAWENANRRAHELLMRVIDGDGEVVSTTGGVVTLDLKSLLTQTADRFGVGGRVADKLPASAGEIVLLESDQLATAQDVANVLDAAGAVLVVLALLLFALAIFLAKGWRREALRACGFGLLAAGVAGLVARSVAGDYVVDALATTEAVRPAVEATWTIGTSLLVEVATATVFYGVAIVLVAWLAGPTRLATGVRRLKAPFLREPRYAWGGLAVIVLLLIAWGPTPATRSLVPMLFLIALLALGVEALRRQTAREFPNVTIDDSVNTVRGWWGSARGQLGRDSS